MSVLDWLFLVTGLLTAVLGLELLTIHWGVGGEAEREALFHNAYRGYFVTLFTCIACVLVVMLAEQA
jgi:hypothetical protein